MIRLIASILDLSGTIIALQPTTAPGAIAEVTMNNFPANGPQDEGTHALTHDGLTVSVTFDWDQDGGQSDAITVTPPDGVICIPADCRLTLPEGAKGVVILYAWQGA